MLIFQSSYERIFENSTESKTQLFHPQVDNWSEHFAWTDKGIVLVGKTAVGRATIEALRMNRPQLLRVRQMWVTLGKHPPDFDQF